MAMYSILCVVFFGVFARSQDYKANIIPASRPIWLMANTTIELTCEYDTNTPATWYNGNTEVVYNKRKMTSSSDPKSTSKLTILDSIAGDTENYTCRTGTTSATAAVKILTLKVSDALYKAGTNATLVAKPVDISAKDASQMTITWLKNGTYEIVNGKKYIIDKANNSLTIIAPKQEDIGLYTCEFSFPVKNDGHARQTILSKSLTFNAKPYIKTPFKSKNLVEGDVLMLECPAKGYPVPEIYWYRDDQLLTTGNRTTIGDLSKDEAHGNIFVRNGQLRIVDLEFSDAGNYTCEATNDYGTYNSSVVLRVKDKLAALWPFLAIVVEVVILCVIIFIYEKKKGKELDNAAAHLNGKHEQYGEAPQEKKSSKEDVRLRK